MSVSSSDRVMTLVVRDELGPPLTFIRAAADANGQVWRVHAIVGESVDLRGGVARVLVSVSRDDGTTKPDNGCYVEPLATAEREVAS